jgi:hypothetical protein
MKLDKQLEKLANLEDVSIDTEATNENGERIKEMYCDHLPYAIKGHEMALAVVKNPFAKIIIQLAITLLKAIGNRFCEVNEEEK